VLLDLLIDCPIPFWISYSCKEGNQTNAGQDFQSAVDIAQGAIAVGINCTKPELITDLLSSAKSNKPYIVYPNSGRVWDAKSKVWCGGAVVGFSNELVSQWVNAGAEIVGGCCGIGAVEIERLTTSG
jgi:homocysteine S-methyltransferase